MGKIKNMYTVTFRSGIEKKVIREEEDGKTLIGLWIWAKSRRDEVFINVEEGVIMASEIAMIDNPVNLDGRDLNTGYVADEIDEPTSYGMTFEDEIALAEEEIK